LSENIKQIPKTKYIFKLNTDIDREETLQSIRLRAQLWSILPKNLLLYLHKRNIMTNTLCDESGTVAVDVALY
jgi:hypothetical protein